MPVPIPARVTSPLHYSVLTCPRLRNQGSDLALGRPSRSSSTTLLDELWRRGFWSLRWRIEFRDARVSTAVRDLEPRKRQGKDLSVRVLHFLSLRFLLSNLLR